MTMVLMLLAAAPTADQLAGKWEGGGFVIVLEKSGAGSMSDGPGVPQEPLKWKLKDKKLLVTQEGETEAYAVSLDGDTLSLSGGDLDQPVKLKRAGAATAAKAEPAKAMGPPTSAHGTCDGACKHYLQCVGAQNEQNKQMCLLECAASGLNPYQLALFIATDCLTAVAIVNAAEQQAWNQVKQQSSSNNSQCKGCQRWGDSCMWTSQSDWGKGAYSGAAADCDPSCCP